MRHFQFFFICAAILLCQDAAAQKRQAIYFEGIGNGIIYSLNYDRRFTKSETGFGFRIGANSLGGSALFFPAQVNYIFGQKHAFEFGAGMTYSNQWSSGNSSSPHDHYFLGNACVMYRYQPSNGLLIRAGWAPTFAPKSSGSDYVTTSIFYFWPGVSLGWRF